jgi:hypothetical protein
MQHLGLSWLLTAISIGVVLAITITLHHRSRAKAEASLPSRVKSNNDINEFLHLDFLYYRSNTRTKIDKSAAADLFEATVEPPFLGPGARHTPLLGRGPVAFESLRLHR